ncbi:MAG: hypothetical protein K9G58_02490 [Bacteroidales bacterium]|nr:hypothetical protein [Bacteroidales bacterium]MCF8386983.1 hypothetical protein [Bacteroidales bacterium]MCF8397006.1 hypothetical protein [Bacteroidales bacterium]
MKSLFTLIFATLLITASYSQFQAGIHFPGKEIQEFTIYRTTVAGAWIIDSSYHDLDELEKRYYSNRNNHGRYLNAETIQYNADSNTWEEVERRSFDYHFDTVLKEIIIEEYYKSISEWRIITHNQYNEAGDITHYEWITRDSQGDISQGFLYTYEYNQAGYNIYELSRLYDPEQEQWINSLEVYYEYDENGKN